MGVHSREHNRVHSGERRHELGFRARHHYCTRHTFISQTQDDGADGQILKWTTHAPPSSAFDGYTRTQWSRLCQEFLKLRVGDATAEDATEAVPSVDAELVREVPVAHVVDVRPIVVRALPAAVSPSLTAQKAKTPGDRSGSPGVSLVGARGFEGSRDQRILRNPS